MFENPFALMLLALLLPVIILYLLKPKPRILKIPSLLFFHSEISKKSRRPLSRTLLRDPLLLIQLITITILVLGLANPYYLGSAGAGRTVIILDSSASMASIDVSPDRFSMAVDIAKEYIENSDKVSIILVESTPVLLLRDADRQKAIYALQQLKPGATGTALNDAVLLGAGLLGNEKDKLAVISDFSGQDITQARKIIEAKGISAEYRQVGKGGSNAGIVDAVIDGNNLKFAVKNYDHAEKDVQVNVIQKDSVVWVNRTLKQGSREFFYAANISGLIRVSIDPGDDLSLDNRLFISVPEKIKERVLLISDSKDKKTPIALAFNSIPSISMDKVSFDRAPRNFDHDMVVLHDYTRNSPLPGMMDDLRRYVEGGGVLVFVAGEELQFMDTGGLMPVTVSEMAEPSSFVTGNTGLTRDIDFGISPYLKATLKEGAVELASSGEGPVLAYRTVGKGKVVYLGINDKWGEFHLLPSYPVFWFNLLKFSNPASSELNYKTGTVLPLGSEEHVEGPGSAFTTANLYLDETGFYKIGEKTIASNLLDEKESDISIKKIDFETEKKGSGANVERKHLETIFSIFAILMIALELYYLKYRGDI